jgi:hypothetical protein
VNVQHLNPFRPIAARQGPALGLREAPAPRPICDDQTGFIFHPPGIPLTYRRLWFLRAPRTLAGERSDIGLIFECDRYIPTGAMLEVAIPLRGEEQTFRGKVVLVRSDTDRFAIGMCLETAADAARLRIVEQICHIEAYLQRKKYLEGPYALNRERAAAEWISRYAGTVPTLQG